MSKYTVQMEVEGPLAHFGRVDSGDSFSTYPAPTWSAAKAMFESVCMLRSAMVVPFKVMICKPVIVSSLTENYRGVNRKGGLIVQGNAQQVRRTVLHNVCYKLFAHVRSSGHEFNNVCGKKINGAHFYVDRFNRRIKKGQSHSIPFLGLKPFVVTYFGELRDSTEADVSINIQIPLMLHSVFNSSNKPRFEQNVHVKEGVLEYAE